MNIKRALVHAFIILGTLLVSLLLWRFFLGTDINYRSYTNKGSLFEELWYNGTIQYTTDTGIFNVDTPSGLVGDYADQHNATLRRTMQNEWLSNNGFNGMLYTYICEKNYVQLKALSADSANISTGTGAGCPDAVAWHSALSNSTTFGFSSVTKAVTF